MITKDTFHPEEQLRPETSILGYPIKREVEPGSSYQISVIDRQNPTAELHDVYMSSTGDLYVVKASGAIGGDNPEHTVETAERSSEPSQRVQRNPAELATIQEAWHRAIQ